MAIIGLSGYKGSGKKTVKRFLQDLAPNLEITNVYLPDEAKAIKEAGGKLIRIHRWQRWEKELWHNNPDASYSDWEMEYDAWARHRPESEIALDLGTQFDWVIDNNGTMEELEEQVRKACQQLHII